MGKGGGGTAVTHSAPPIYQQMFHMWLLSGISPTTDYIKGGRVDDSAYLNRDPVNVVDFTRRLAWEASPYANEVAYDPGTLTSAGVGDELHRIQERVTDLQDHLFDNVDINDPSSGTPIAPETLWSSWIDEASGAAWVNDAVDAFEVSTRQAHLRAVRDLAMEFASANAVNSTGFMIARAVLEAQRARSLNAYRANLIGRSASEIRGLWTAMLQGKISAAATQLDASRASIIAKVDQSRTNLDIQVLDITWDIDVWSRAGSLLSALGGSVVSDARDLGPSKAQSALAGMLVGAGAAYGLKEIGVMSGSLGGPLGIVAGAAIGGLMSIL